MMSYDENTVYQRSMTRGREMEAKRHYEFAIFSYQYAYDIATNAHDEARRDPFERMERCKSIVDPTYKPQQYTPLGRYNPPDNDFDF